MAWLRDGVAEGVREARMENRVIAGIEVHDYAQRGLTLRAYEEQVLEGLWASALELQLGAEVLWVSAGLKMGNAYFMTGEQRNYYYDIVVHGEAATSCSRRSTHTGPMLRVTSSKGLG